MTPRAKNRIHASVRRGLLGATTHLGDQPLKTVAAGAAAPFVAASPTCPRTNTFCCDSGPIKDIGTVHILTDRNALTDLRIDLVKGALQLTPEQQKYWPPVENAIRARAEGVAERPFAKIAETMGKRADESPAEVMSNRDPIAFLQRRAEALAQRSADLNKLAEAWQPLYKTLSPEQRQRMAALAVFVLHDMTDAVERRRLQSDDD